MDQYFSKNSHNSFNYDCDVTQSSPKCVQIFGLLLCKILCPIHFLHTKMSLKAKANYSLLVKYLSQSGSWAVWPDLALFWNYLAINFVIKVAQMFGWLFWHLLKPLLFKSNWLGFFWKTWATFNFNIWSHCSWVFVVVDWGASSY